MIRGTLWGNESIPLRPTVSNCFINHCGVGVAVVAWREFTSSLLWKPVLLNNTFADNEFVNVYNGAYPVSQSSPSIGLNVLRLTNNIFLEPSATNPGFAGVHAADVRVMRNANQ